MPHARQSLNQDREPPSGRSAILLRSPIAINPQQPVGDTNHRSAVIEDMNETDLVGRKRNPNLITLQSQRKKCIIAWCEAAEQSRQIGRWRIRSKCAVVD